MARAVSKNQVSDPGPSWPSCFSFWLPWQPEFWIEFNSLNNICRASPKEHPCQVSSRLEMFKEIVDGRRT